MLVAVAVKSPLRRLFTYEADAALPKGTRVRVPFGHREVVGFVWRDATESPKGLKKISKVLDEEPSFDEPTLTFYERAAQYYGVSLGELLSVSVPKKVQDGKPLKDYGPKVFAPKLCDLSNEQQDIFQNILKTKNFVPHLLMGETGSGKTEIYLHLFSQIMEEGGQVLFLVPEISLTPQFEERLKERLGLPATVFHSQLKESKREEAFSRARSGRPDIFLGARSALFLPFKNLKLIVVDEEHDASYKQFERAPYNARDLALLKAQLLRIPVVLGSATPSLESIHRAEVQKTPLYRLPPYFKRSKVTQVIVDLKKSFKEKERSFVSPELHEGIIENLMKGEQSLLFLNRRGSASNRLCLGCGDTASCKNCSVSLTPHRDRQKLICHWCGYQQNLKDPCGTCGGDKFLEGGIGTKELEAQIQLRFPEARVARLDRDETLKPEQLASVLKKFSAGEIDILVGTQMISKGIDISKLSLVGIIFADLGWGVPDFRGAERSFQLLKQVCGRAGRRGQDSKVIIQTFQPTHPIFEWLQKEEAYDEMLSHEMPIRKLGVFPPFSRLSLLTLSHRDLKTLSQASSVFAERLNQMAKALGIEVWGPTDAPLGRWKGVYRHHILVRGANVGAMTGFVQAALDDWERLSMASVKLKLDRDPYHFL